MVEVFTKRTRIPSPADVVFRWHELPGSLEKLTPPGDPVALVERTGGIRDGAKVVLRIGRGPLSILWVAAHRGYIAGRQFEDVQVRGPFASWIHTHRFEPDGERACFLEDRVEYTLPFGRLGRWLGGGLVRRRLQRLFEYRHAVTLRETVIHSDN